MTVRSEGVIGASNPLIECMYWHAYSQRTHTETCKHVSKIGKVNIDLLLP